MAQILWNRGLHTPEQAATFLSPDRSRLLDPFLLKDMDRAVAALKAALVARKPIMVYGDYDVDGVTGTSILVASLRSLGATVEYYIPNRFTEGYGLNAAAIEAIHQQGFDTILSVDTGTSALLEADLARQMGITLVITDHHEPGPQLPDAAAVVNPKRADCPYPFKGLSGVGVAFKLALALEAPAAWDCLDIVTLGTIADMVPLVEENRIIVKEGLEALRNTRRPGLRALLQVAGVKEDGPVTATHVGYALGPRINALGRMGDAKIGVDLLLTDDPARGAELARHLDEENRSRQEVEAAMVEEAMAQAEQFAGSHLFVLAGEGWHPGVVGIGASRIMEAFHRPAILLSVDGETAKGSARSIPGFHLYRALYECRDLLERFGGHAMAAGMTLPKQNIPLLRERLNRLAQEQLSEDDLTGELAIDAWIDFHQLKENLARELSVLEPHGIGNPSPLLAVREASLVETRIVGREGQHVRLRVRGSGAHFPIDGIAFNLSQAVPPAPARIQIAFRPEINVWNGRESLQLQVRDLQTHEVLDTGSAANVARLPEVGWDGYLQWDPLAHLHATGIGEVLSSAIDGRGARLQAAFARLRQDAGLEEEEAEASVPLYTAQLAAMPGSRVLVITGSPWAACAATAALQRLFGRGQVAVWAPGSADPGVQICIGCWGGIPAGAATAFTDLVFQHPPYSEGQLAGLAGARLHLAWREGDWMLNETALSWPYPDRDALVRLFKVLKDRGEANSQSLAALLAAGGQETVGLWNRLRAEAGLRVFTEMGLVRERAPGSFALVAGTRRFELEESERYRKGVQGRDALARCRRLFDDGALTYNREYQEGGRHGL